MLGASWFLIALVGPLMYALTNHIDKILLEKYFKEGGAGTLILFSSLASVLALPLLFFMDTSVFSIEATSVIWLTVVGILNVLVLWCFFLALKNEEASVTVVFYQLVPVFGYVLGFFILGEVLSTMQLLAMAIVILGTTIVSFEIDAENRFRLRKDTIVPMLGAAFFWAVETVIFKAVALEEQLWRTLFWEHLMLAIIGLCIFVLMPSYRHHFLAAIRANSRGILGLNVINEVLFMVGNVAFSYAALLVPIALVLITESYQPLFVFAIGIFLTVFFPRIAVEKIHARHLAQKSLAIALTGIGTYLLITA